VVLVFCCDVEFVIVCEFACVWFCVVLILIDWFGIFCDWTCLWCFVCFRFMLAGVCVVNVLLWFCVYVA